MIKYYYWQQHNGWVIMAYNLDKPRKDWGRDYYDALEYWNTPCFRETRYRSTLSLSVIDHVEAKELSEAEAIMLIMEIQ